RLREVFPRDREIGLGGVKRAEAGHVENLAVSPDGQYLLLNWQRHVPRAGGRDSYHTEGRLGLWDLATARLLKVLDQSNPGCSRNWPLLRFSPDGRTAVTQDREVCVWDVRTGKKLHELQLVTEVSPSHSYLHSVKDARFSAGGEVLFTAADRGRMDLIDIKA